MKTEQIKIDSGETANIYIRKPKEPTCDGHTTGCSFTLSVPGACSISVVKGEKKSGEIMETL